MNDLVLALNAGSSSLKFAVFAADNSSTLAEVRGEISGIGRLPRFSARTAEGDPVEPDALVSLDTSLGHERLLDLLLSWIGQHVGDRIVAVGHRVVHGGRHFVRPALVTDDVVDRLEALTSMAPLHQPHNIAAIRSVAAWRPDLPQVACFDTSFHRTQPRLSQLFALPRALTEEGIIRYGFHGLSYEYIAGVLPEKIGELADGRVVVAHLGNGSSMCAMRHRKSVATSMGFSALDGLVMGRRCGALDPGVVLHLMRQKSMDADKIEDLLYRRFPVGSAGVDRRSQRRCLHGRHRGERRACAPGDMRSVGLAGHRAGRGGKCRECVCHQF